MNRTLKTNPLATALVVALAAGSACPAFAQPETEDPDGYVDRIINPDRLEPLPPDEFEQFDATGLPRSLSVDIVTSQIERGDENFSESGVSLGGFWETKDWGSLSLDAAVFYSDNERDGDDRWVGSATLWQRNVRFDDQWRADNGLGVLSTLSAPLTRDQYRFFLPGVPQLGASTSWINDETGLHLMGSLGRAGVFSGTRIVAFDEADGNVGSFAAQWQWSPAWTGAATFLATDGQIVPDAIGGALFEDGRTEAGVLSTAWTGERDRISGHLQASGGYLGDAQGAWLDGESRRGRYTHNYGVFRLDPDLAWGALPISNDAQGGYVRTRYEDARWNWNLGLDKIDSVSGNSFEGYYGSAFVRYQARANLGFGGNLNVRDSDSTTDYNTRVFVDRRSPWGLTRVQLDQTHASDGQRDDWQVTLDQDLPVRGGSRLALSTSYGAQTFDDIGQTDTFSIAALGGLELGDTVSLDGNVRWTRGSGPEAFRGTDINLSLNWRVANHWWLSTSIYRNTGRQRSPFLLDPLVPPDQFLDIPRERSIYLSLRYERQAGTSAMVLGGRPGSAAGSVRGSVFLDENGDGIRSASELPAANVTVVLDGRYSVRTDSQGNFEFPRVAAGGHEITVVPDNLPLPWFLDEAAATPVRVNVREAARVDIGARRDR